MDELTQAVLANVDVPSLLGRATALVAQHLAVEYSAIWGFQPGQSELALRAGFGWQHEAMAGARAALAMASPNTSSVGSFEPVIVEDWPSETRFGPPPAPHDRQVISSLYVGIPGLRHPFGSLGVDATSSRMFGADEIQFLQAVASILALANERQDAGQSIDRQVEERTREIEQRLVAAAQDKAVLEERQRLARDLHDSVIQALYSVTLHAQGAQRLLASGDLPKALEALRGLQETAQEGLDEMRLLIFELRPPILEQIGLVAALQARLNSVEGRANLQTRLIADVVGDLPALAEQTLYRIAQEALNNVLKHAHAQHVTVRLQRAEAAVQLEINDDGVGFDPSSAETTGGMGLRGIAERAAQLAGTFTLRSAAGAGTYMCVEVPL